MYESEEDALEEMDRLEKEIISMSNRDLKGLSDHAILATAMEFSTKLIQMNIATIIWQTAYLARIIRNG
jgi:hypothetical protein